jgi:L-ascorbate metabolism protein UlaG (beta-lactamase superfamily)
MELQYFGANCVRISSKKASVIVDDNLAELGLKPVTKPGDIALFTNNEHRKPAVDTKLTVEYPGEYEVGDVAVQGIAARAHMDEEGGHTAVIYKVVADDIRAVVMGHVHPDLTDDQIEALGTVDVLIIPVGGNGYTLDAVGALGLIKKIEPKMVIPVHYADPSVKYQVSQNELPAALKEISMEPREIVTKLKIKPADLTDLTQLVVLERQ